MPRSLRELLEQADDLADSFEDYDADPGKARDAAALGALRAAFQGRVRAEASLATAVAAARGQGHSWTAIGAMVGTSGEAARQRYGRSETGTALALPAGADAIALEQALERLPARCRTLLRALRSDPPLSYEEIASRLTIPIGAIGPSRERCLARLRRALDEIRRQEGEGPLT